MKEEKKPVGWLSFASLIAVLIAIAIAILALWQAAKAEPSSSYRSNVSWYGPGLFGNHLGCGGILTTHTFGVAHKTLPCGTVIKICMRRCAYARVIDRGPFVWGRDLDLTGPLAYRVGLLPSRSTGVATWWVIG